MEPATETLDRPAPKRRTPTDRTAKSAEAKAFNLGADARLAGKPFDRNPYTCASRQWLRKAWRQGWLDVAENYPADRLPPVEVACS